jgi:hypothetical protein
MVCFRSRISLLIFCLDDLSIDDNGMLKSPMTTLLELICAFRSFRVCLMKLGVLTLGAYRLIIVISFWCISPFITMECPSLSHLASIFFLIQTLLFQSKCGFLQISAFGYCSTAINMAIQICVQKHAFTTVEYVPRSRSPGSWAKSMFSFFCFCFRNLRFLFYVEFTHSKMHSAEDHLMA